MVGINFRGINFEAYPKYEPRSSAGRATRDARASGFRALGVEVGEVRGAGSRMLRTCASGVKVNLQQCRCQIPSWLLRLVSSHSSSSSRRPFPHFETGPGVVVTIACFREKVVGSKRVSVLNSRHFSLEQSTCRGADHVRPFLE